MARVRRLRHWKQQFQKDAKFIWRRALVWDGKKSVVGEEIPESLFTNKAKLRRFWEAKAIELADFSAPDVVTGQVSGQDATTVTSDNSSENAGSDEDEADDNADKRAARQARRKARREAKERASE